jgi:cytoskeletal protein RodZ
VNPQFRKVALIAAALGLIVSLYFALSRGGDDETAPTTTAAQTTTAATTTEPEVTTTAETTTEPKVTTTAATTTAPAESTFVRITVSVPGDKAPTVKHFTIKQDSQVVFTVESELADEVHLHGYDLSADVAPGEPATISFKATAPGIFEAELESRGLPIAELEVRP